jgi:hypothetical protein
MKQEIWKEVKYERSRPNLSTYRTTECHSYYWKLKNGVGGECCNLLNRNIDTLMSSGHQYCTYDTNIGLCGERERARERERSNIIYFMILSPLAPILCLNKYFTTTSHKNNIHIQVLDIFLLFDYFFSALLFLYYSQSIIEK